MATAPQHPLPTADRVTETKTRADAWALLCKYTAKPQLRKHALAVEAAMRAYARHFNEDEELWGMVGLLHDFDYERYPSLEEHPFEGQKILGEQGYSETLRRAIMAHAPHTGTSRETPLEKAIFAVDELAGFIVAVALVRPSKKLADVDEKSVMKKLKAPAFAAAVSRSDIAEGAKELGLELNAHVAIVLKALQEQADTLGL